MKAVILAGGLGSRLSEETHLKPKPMIEIGEKPILWHIMKLYSFYNINDFIICVGYKGYVIKEYFYNYFMHHSDVRFDLSNNTLEFYDNYSEPWHVTIINTGEDTATGSRLKRVEKYLNYETFCFTYGDGVSDVNITELIKFHKQKKKLATMTSVQPPGRFGTLEIKENEVVSFLEKPSGDGSWINGGFFVVEPEIFDMIEKDLTSWEYDLLPELIYQNQLSAYKHHGFWLPMDTLRDKYRLEQLWKTGKAPWKLWQ